MKYAWKKGFHTQVKANLAGLELKRISIKYKGKFEAAQVVDESKDVAAPLHPCFEWDDTIAAGLHRNFQARYLMQGLVIVAPEKNINKPIRAFINVSEGRSEPGFYDVFTVMSDSELRKKAVQQAWLELQAWRVRYKEYEELAEVFNIIDKKNPCELCKYGSESKNNKRCTECEKRIEYMKIAAN